LICGYAAFCGRGGTFAPLRRAFDNPIAIACLRFFTGCLPERMWCISVRTSLCALRPYLRPRDLARELLRERELRLEDFLGMITSYLDQTAAERVGLASKQGSPLLQIGFVP
jgi:hypothetical protein